MGRSIRMYRCGTAFLALVISASGLAGQSRSTLETKITASGDQIELKWGKKHPWDAELQANGASLQVEYRTRGGNVGLDCLSTTPVPDAGHRAMRPAGGGCGILGRRVPNDERALVFHLPGRITAAPAGAVCLSFALPSRRILPVRRADEQGRETARFLYAVWATRVGRRAEQASLEAKREVVRQEIAANARAIAAQEATNSRSGWESASSCQSIESPRLVRAVDPARPLAPPENRDDVARQVCTMRVANADQAVQERVSVSRGRLDLKTAKLRSGRVHGPSTIDYLFSLLPARDADPNRIERQAQAEAFRRDWARWSPRIRQYVESLGAGGYSEPHFGALTDQLRLQTITRAAGRVIADSVASGRLDPRIIAGYIGGTLEAYTRCVADGKAQLETTYASTLEYRKRSPQLEAAARQQLVRGCQAGVGELARLRAEHAELEEELRVADAALAAGGDPGPLPTRRVELNDAVCTP